MSESLSRLTERIHVHFQKESYLSNYLEIKQRENQGFEKLRYVITLQGFDLPNDESELDDIGNGIAKNLVAREFSHFLTTVASVVCKTTETTLDKLVETVDKAYTDLWNDGYEPDQLYIPYLLNNEIRKRKSRIERGIKFLNKILEPITHRALGEKQIIFANKRCFRKTYPENIEKQILVSERQGIQNTEIHCTIVQKLQVLNQYLMSKIIVTDSEKLRLNFHDT